MSTSEDDLRRSLEAATLGLASMAAMMTRLGDLLVDWDGRAAVEGSRTADMWRLAANELRGIVTASGAGTRTAASMVRPRESSLTMADLRRRYDG